jgi:hypothetical protein
MENKNKLSEENDGIEGIGFLLFFTFIILLIIKIEWQIDISWYFVFGPLWIPLVLIFLVVTTMEIMNAFKKKKE